MVLTPPGEYGNLDLLNQLRSGNTDLSLTTRNALGQSSEAEEVLEGPPRVICQTFADTAATQKPSTPFGTDIENFGNNKEVLVESVICTF
jgi:hypothetical protein